MKKKPIYKTVSANTTKRPVFKAEHTHTHKVFQLPVMLMEVLQMNLWTSLWKYTPNID